MQVSTHGKKTESMYFSNCPEGIELVVLGSIWRVAILGDFCRIFYMAQGFMRGLIGQCFCNDSPTSHVFQTALHCDERQAGLSVLIALCAGAHVIVSFVRRRRKMFGELREFTMGKDLQLIGVI